MIVDTVYTGKKVIKVTKFFKETKIPKIGNILITGNKKHSYNRHKLNIKISEFNSNSSII